MKITFTSIALMLSMLGVTSCRQNAVPVETALGPDVVAVVAGRPITRASLESELNRRGPGVTKEAVLGDLIRYEATLAQIRANGFDHDPAVVDAIERMLVARYEERELAHADAPVVTDGEIRAAYAANANRYSTPAEVRGSLLFLKSSPKATQERRMELKRRADQLLADAIAGDGATFDRLILEHSDDQTTRYRSGDMGWLKAQQDVIGWNESVTKALWAIPQPGGYAPVVETPGGFFIVRLTEIKAAGTKPLAEVSEAIRYQLRQAKREQQTAAFHARMSAGLVIRTNTDSLAGTAVVARADQQPPVIP